MKAVVDHETAKREYNGTLHSRGDSGPNHPFEIVYVSKSGTKIRVNCRGFYKAFKQAQSAFRSAGGANLHEVLIFGLSSKLQDDFKSAFVAREGGTRHTHCYVVTRDIALGSTNCSG